MAEATFERAYPMALRVARARATAAVVSGAIPVADRADFEQEGLTACWRALPRYDPARASLQTFVERVIASRISTLVRTARRLPTHVSLSSAGLQLIDSGAEALEFQADVERISSAFDRHDRQLVLLLLEHSPAEAGRILGLPRSTVHDRILRLRRGFLAAGFGPNGDRQ